MIPIDLVFQIEKFWNFVQLIPFHECWEWTGRRSSRGYGRINLGNHSMLAHRFSLGLKEELNPNLVVDHICRNRLCVNPKHLRQVSRTINTLENSIGPAPTNKAKTHCVRGHEYNEENTYYRKDSGRSCRACERVKRRAKYFRAKNRAAAKAASIQKGH